MVRAAILQIEKDKKIEVSDSQIVEIIAKEAKKRKDALEDYPKKWKRRFNRANEPRNKNTKWIFTKTINRRRINSKNARNNNRIRCNFYKRYRSCNEKAKETIGAAANGKAINEVAKKYK